MVDSLCQTYHWTLEEAMSLTMPQIILLNHASSVNYARSQKDDKDGDSVPQGQSGGVYKGKHISEMTCEEYLEYWASPF